MALYSPAAVQQQTKQAKQSAHLNGCIPSHSIWIERSRFKRVLSLWLTGENGVAANCLDACKRQPMDGDQKIATTSRTRAPVVPTASSSVYNPLFGCLVNTSFALQICIQCTHAALSQPKSKRQNSDGLKFGEISTNFESKQPAFQAKTAAKKRARECLTAKRIGERTN